MEGLTLNVSIMPRFFSCLMHFLMEASDEFVFLYVRARTSMVLKMGNFAGLTENSLRGVGG